MWKHSIATVLLSATVLSAQTCGGSPPAEPVVTLPKPDGSCPDVFVSLAGLGHSCVPKVDTIQVSNPCSTPEHSDAATTHFEQTGEWHGATASSKGSQWLFEAPYTTKDNFKVFTETCLGDVPSFATGNYTYHPYGQPDEGSQPRYKGTVTVLFSTAGGHTLEVESTGPALALKNLDSSRVGCAGVNRCAGLIAPGGSVEFAVEGWWSITGSCPTEVTGEGFRVLGPAGSSTIRCSVSKKSTIRVARSGYLGEVEAEIDEMLVPAGDELEAPGGSNVVLRALDASIPDLSWQCQTAAGSVISASGPEISIGSVRTDYTCTVRSVCEPPTVTLEATAEDGSALVDLDVTTPAVIDLDPTTSVLFKVSGDGLEPAPTATLLVNGDAIDEFMGETTVVMQEILSSDAAYDLQAEVQACGAAVRSPAIQLRRN